jgi:GH35 family endo-1,4-beta-xylanase
MDMDRRKFLTITGCAGLLSVSDLAHGEDKTEISAPKTEKEILDGIETRVARHRSTDAQLTFVNAEGKSLPGTRANIKLTRHAFKLGANAFGVETIQPKSLQQEYKDRFAGLLNYATLPFYWGAYEPEAGKTGEERLGAMAEWCAKNNIAAKGHPLVWHEVFPKWAETLKDDDVRQRLEKRVREIIAHFKDRIHIWDVVNEATVSSKHVNAVGRWALKDGAAALVAEALKWAHEADPDATLLYNDFNVSLDFEKLVSDLQTRKAPVNVIGVQSHMHKARWTMEKLWSVCETYGRFGLPLHFTEATVLSGKYKADDDWNKTFTDWLSTPEGEAVQADYGEQFYSVLFSHPALEAVTWWDFSDLASWMGAPSGLVHKDMTPKPLYDRIHALFKKRWTTDTTVTADAEGKAKARCFFGTHHVTAKTDSGAEVSGNFDLPRGGDAKVQVVLK